jgi:hypothetical protein
MMKYTFTYECTYAGQPNTVVTVTTDAVTLPEILQEFCNFLRASGFQIESDSLAVVAADESDINMNEETDSEYQSNESIPAGG